MQHIIKTTLILAVIALGSCSQKKSLDFFAKGGITIGAPAALGSGSYKIPIEFETEIVHSGKWIDAVDADVAGADILLTATFTSSNGKSGYPGYIEVKGISPGTYFIKYRDPNGTVHTLGRAILP
jgi:hypothetical protein